MRITALFSGLFALSIIVSPMASAQGLPAAGILFQQDNPFSALVGKSRERSQRRGDRSDVERYVLTSDDRMFLFEELASGARVQFLCGENDQRIDCVIDMAGPSPEIHALSATRGPRGDVIYKDARDHTLIRIAAYGGATVYWPGETRGIAASKSFGDDRSLRLGFTDMETASRRAQGAAAQISALTGSPVFFDISAANASGGANAAVLADAIVTSAKGIASVAQDETGAAAISSRIKRVIFLPSTDAEISLGGSVLEIRYVPNLDIEGRPSSAKVAQFLEESL
ncbi:DUF4908 domain-containing protein [Hyphococcus flavus]|uniref:DUF4908 domain-containing protein n=1 Tax=Hyphococcus flavus TaxID=1866326 RepID=A0AAE9ZDJ7_9PROT|nr:DUF4908 domain-containing protein [Hyphococcus flavus]WDI32566.1 DUF4908 domain-containing protein [Hyphococcus flavus]